MTLVRRNLLSFAAVALLTALGCAYVLLAFREMAETALEQRRIAQVVEAAGRLEAGALQVILLLEQYEDNPDSATLNQMAVNRAANEAGRNLIRSLTTLPRVVALLNRYEQILPRRVAAADRMVALVQARASNRLLRSTKRERDALDTEARFFLRQIDALENGALAASLRASQARRRELYRNVVALFGSIGVLIVGISVLTARDISRRLVPLLGVAQEVSQGTFTTQLAVQGSDEVARLGKAFNQMNRDLQQLDQAKQGFVALASHQLRTPATAVKANVAMLLDGYFGEVTAEQREALSDAFESNERQLDIIGDMLHVARIQTGRLTLAKADTDLSRLVDEVVAEHRFGIQSREQAIEVRKPGEAVHLPADGGKLRMAVDNLVSNASKYTPRGGHISVRLDSTADGVEISVQDTGIGIAPEDRHKLFQRFSRLANPLAMEVQGTGLGLYLANEIVKLHGGIITVQSAPNAGSTFCVTLPRG